MNQKQVDESATYMKSYSFDQLWLVHVCHTSVISGEGIMQQPTSAVLLQLHEKKKMGNINKRKKKQSSATKGVGMEEFSFRPC